MRLQVALSLPEVRTGRPTTLGAGRRTSWSSSHSVSVSDALTSEDEVEEGVAVQSCASAPDYAASNCESEYFTAAAMRPSAAAAHPIAPREVEAGSWLPSLYQFLTLNLSLK